MLTVIPAYLTYIPEMLQVNPRSACGLTLFSSAEVPKLRLGFIVCTSARGLGASMLQKPGGLSRFP